MASEEVPRVNEVVRMIIKEISRVSSGNSIGQCSRNPIALLSMWSLRGFLLIFCRWL